MLFARYVPPSPIEVIHALIDQQHSLLSPEERELANVQQLRLPDDDPRQSILNELDDLICIEEFKLN